MGTFSFRSNRKLSAALLECTSTVHHRQPNSGQSNFAKMHRTQMFSFVFRSSFDFNLHLIAVCLRIIELDEAHHQIKFKAYLMPIQQSVWLNRWSSQTIITCFESCLLLLLFIALFIILFFLLFIQCPIWLILLIDTIRICLLLLLPQLIYERKRRRKSQKQDVCAYFSPPIFG